MIVLGAGGNPENLEFFSKALGKATIEVMNTSENKGSQGSYTKSYQALGRELMTPEEIRTMPRNWCLLMISGVAPFYSRKYNLKDHPNYHLVEAEGGKPFDYDRRAEQSFADFISNVKDVKTVKLCALQNYCIDQSYVEIVSTITTLISNVVTFAGGLLLLFGAVTLGTNLKDHNGPGISSGAWAMAGGVLIIAVATYFGTLTVG